MGYMHIDNLYKDARVLSFKHVYALEKIHGTSAHISWDGESVRFFSGGEKYENFVMLFDAEELKARFERLFDTSDGRKVIVFGEAYGGKQQGMAHVYGPNLKFVAFDIKVGECWLDVPTAANLVCELGLEFVEFWLVHATEEVLNAERDRPSEQARRNGMGDDKMREGIVIRPLFEVTTSAGKRLIAKHKRAEFQEVRTHRKIGLPPMVLEDAKAVAEEWVTEMRLQHVEDELKSRNEPYGLGDVIRCMIDDVKREGYGEIVWSKAVGKAIAVRVKELIKNNLGR